MHIIAQRLQITVSASVHDQRLVATAEQMPEQFVPPVEASGVGTQKPFHPRHQISPRSFHDHMKVIGHQAQGMHLPTALAASFVQGVDEPLPIRVIAENGFAPVAPIHHVVNRTGIFHSELAGLGSGDCATSP